MASALTAQPLADPNRSPGSENGWKWAAARSFMHWLEAAAVLASKEGAASLETFVQSNVCDGRGPIKHTANRIARGLSVTRQGDTKPDCIDFAGREDPPK